MDRYKLVCVFRAFQWPLDLVEYVELRDKFTYEVVARVSGAGIRNLIEHQVATAKLQAVIAEDMRRQPVALPSCAEPPPSALPFSPRQREAFRTKRQTKRRTR